MGRACSCYNIVASFPRWSHCLARSEFFGGRSSSSSSSNETCIVACPAIIFHCSGSHTTIIAASSESGTPFLHRPAAAVCSNMCVCMYVYIYIYIYIVPEADRLTCHDFSCQLRLRTSPKTTLTPSPKPQKMSLPHQQQKNSKLRSVTIRLDCYFWRGALHRKHRRRQKQCGGVTRSIGRNTRRRLCRVYFMGGDSSTGGSRRS